MNNAPSPPGRQDWWTRPRVVLPIVAIVAVMVGLLTPQAAPGRFGDPRLSTHLASSLGARVLADLSKKLGWHVVQDSVGMPGVPTGRTIHAVLAPSRPVTKEEAHRYLEAVRGGDALLYALDGKTPLSDSLHVAHFLRGGILPRPIIADGECPSSPTDFTPPLWPDGRVHLWGVRWLRGVPPDRVVFARLEPEEEGPPIPGEAAVGFPYGRGRIVIVGDPDLLRNDVVRHCSWGTDVIAVRMLEWLRDGGTVPRTTLAFDEYHHGYGRHAGAMDVMAQFVFTHPLGRAIALLVVAALVLLLAVAPRALPPVDTERIERRDPLEQVDALAHAYEQVHATRTVAARLLRGLRWRVEHARPTSWARTDAEFLTAIEDRLPAHAADVALVRQALDQAIPDRELPEVGEALRRIEHTLTTK